MKALIGVMPEDQVTDDSCLRCVRYISQFVNLRYTQVIRTLAQEVRE